MGLLSVMAHHAASSSRVQMLNCVAIIAVCGYLMQVLYQNSPQQLGDILRETAEGGSGGHVLSPVEAELFAVQMALEASTASASGKGDDVAGKGRDMAAAKGLAEGVVSEVIMVSAVERGSEGSKNESSIPQRLEKKRGTAEWKQCEEGCPGTCNLQLGRCDCAYNMSSFPQCRGSTAPACLVSSSGLQSPKKKSSNSSVAPRWLQPCSMITTCRCQLDCHLLHQFTHFMCLPEVHANGTHRSTLEEIFAAPPTSLKRTRIDRSFAKSKPRSYRTFLKFGRGTKTGKPIVTGVSSPEKCRHGCFGRGECREGGNSCKCAKGFTGRWCEQEAPFPFSCFHNCSSRGRCVAGVCICDRNYWGIDCSITKGEAGQPKIWVTLDPPSPSLAESGSKVEPKIFIYDLPPTMNQMWLSTGSAMDVRPDEIFFLERLLRSPHRTVDGEEATFFYMPVFTRLIGTGGEVMRVQQGYRILRAAVVYVQENWPFWSKSYGRNHIVYNSDDFGVCNTGSPPFGFRDPLLENVTVLSNWGYSKNMFQGEVRPCFVPGQDILIPPLHEDRVLADSPFIRDLNKKPLLERKNLAFFEGLMLSNDKRFPVAGVEAVSKLKVYHYSFGYRQELAELFLDNPQTSLEKLKVPFEGVVLRSQAYGHASHYIEEMQKSKFCLAPQGLGWAMRATQAVLLGCIPVLLEENVTQAFGGDLIDWSKISYQFTLEDLPQLFNKLQSISDEDIASKQLAGAKVWASFVHTSHSLRPWLKEKIHNADRKDAFESFIDILRQRSLLRQLNT